MNQTQKCFRINDLIRQNFVRGKTAKVILSLLYGSHRFFFCLSSVSLIKENQHCLGQKSKNNDYFSPKKHHNLIICIEWKPMRFTNCCLERAGQIIVNHEVVKKKEKKKQLSLRIVSSLTITGLRIQHPVRYVAHLLNF